MSSSAPIAFPLAFLIPCDFSRVFSPSRSSDRRAVVWPMLPIFNIDIGPLPANHAVALFGITLIGIGDCLVCLRLLCSASLLHCKHVQLIEINRLEVSFSRDMRHLHSASGGIFWRYPASLAHSSSFGEDLVIVRLLPIPSKNLPKRAPYAFRFS